MGLCLPAPAADDRRTGGETVGRSPFVSFGLSQEVWKLQPQMPISCSISPLEASRRPSVPGPTVRLRTGPCDPSSAQLHRTLLRISAHLPPPGRGRHGCGAPPGATRATSSEESERRRRAPVRAPFGRHVVRENPDVLHTARRSPEGAPTSAPTVSAVSRMDPRAAPTHCKTTPSHSDTSRSPG